MSHSSKEKDEIAETAPDFESGKEGLTEQSHLIDLAANDRLDWKFDIHILPFMFGIWLLAFIDRSNIGNAKIAGLTNDLNIVTGTKFNVALVVFYIPYILVDVPSNWIIKRIKGGIYLPILITGVGVVTTCIGFTKSWGGLVAGRFCLGFCEGGLLGGIAVYLAMFYPRHKLVYRLGLFFSGTALSGAFGGLLATGLAKISFHGFNMWPWIFFVEGAITTVFGLMCFIFLPSTPADARFLSDDERALALARMQADSVGNRTEDVNEEKFNWHWVKMAFTAPHVYMSALAWFFLLVALYSFSLFLPTIISGMGFSDTVSQLFTVPPNFLAFLVLLVICYLSDRFRLRGPFMAGCALFAAIGYIMLLGSKRIAVRYAGTFFVATGVYPAAALVMGWLSNNTAPHYVRATGLGFIIACANCSAFIATFIYLPQDAPNYTLGHAVSLGSLILCAITVSVQIVYLRWENKKRANGDRDYRLGQNEEKLGHLHPAFRYTL